MGWMPYLVIFVQFGIVYYVFESIFNAFMYMHYISVQLEEKRKALFGFCSIWMILVGGILGVSADMIYQIPFVNQHFPMLAITALGALLITIVEFLFGLLFNVALKLDIWSYRAYKYNILGQIELYHSLGWIALSPMVFWIDSVIRYFVCDKGELVNFLVYYTRLLSDFWR